MAGGNGRFSFSQLRQTARLVRQTDCWSKDIHDAFHTGLLADLVSFEGDEDARSEQWLALIEWQREAEIELNLQACFLALAQSIERGNSDLIHKAIRQNYNARELASLTDWLTLQVGTCASNAVAGQKNTRRTGPYKICKQPEYSAVETTAMLLSCLCSLKSDFKSTFPASHAQVTALDAYIQANKGAGDVVKCCSRFSSLLSLSTKLCLLQHELEVRQREMERDRLFSSIYEGMRYQQEGSLDSPPGKKKLVVRRSNLINDSMELLEEDAFSLARGVNIEFANEEGQDAGGLVKEWLLFLCEELDSIVLCQEEQEAERKELSISCPLPEAELMGLLLGLSLLHSIALDVNLSKAMLKTLLSPPSIVSSTRSLEDLAEVRPWVARSLQKILQWNEHEFSQQSFGLTFSFNSGQGDSVDLIPGGADTAVTWENRSLFVQRMCEFLLYEQCERQAKALMQGFERACGSLDSVRLLSVDEFDSLIRGEEIRLNVETVRKLCTLDSSARHEQDYLNAFWDVFHHFEQTAALLRTLLHFVTANHRLSTTGNNRTAFHIVILHGDEFLNRLPTASTCTNTLYLPRYNSNDLLRERVIIALDQGSVGFGLK